MTSFLQNLDADMVDKMRSNPNQDHSQELEGTDQKTNQTAQSIIQTDLTKCWHCTRKVGLLGFKCKCKYIFCSKHRDASQHACTFDYKGAQKELLSTQLKKCEGSSLEKI